MAGNSPLSIPIANTGTGGEGSVGGTGAAGGGGSMPINFQGSSSASAQSKLTSMFTGGSLNITKGIDTKMLLVIGGVGLGVVGLLFVLRKK
jgi:hypothetical protein